MTAPKDIPSYDPLKAEYIRRKGLPYRSAGNIEVANRVEQETGHLIDVFRRIRLSPVINNFYHTVENLADEVNEGVFLRGLRKLRTWSPEERYEAYDDHQTPKTFEHNMLKTVDTIAITRAEIEMGLTPRKRRVFLTQETTRDRSARRMGSYFAKHDIIRAANLLGIEKIFLNRTHLDDILEEPFDLPFGVQMSFDICPSTERSMNNGQFAIDYAVVTVSATPNEEENK